MPSLSSGWPSTLMSAMGRKQTRQYHAIVTLGSSGGLGAAVRLCRGVAVDRDLARARAFADRHCPHDPRRRPPILDPARPVDPLLSIPLRGLLVLHWASAP